MRHMFQLVLVIAALAAPGGFAADTILSAGRDIPVAFETDVVVAGGATGGVTAALAAAKAGARVFLFAEEPYLGADVCASYRLWLEDGETPQTELAKAMFTPPATPADIAPGLPCTYTADRDSAGGHKDTTPHSVLANGKWGSGVHDSVEYPDTVTITADLGKVQAVGRVRAMVYQRLAEIETGRIECSLSEDGVTWSAPVAADNTEMLSHDEHIEAPIVLTAEIAGNARFVRVVAKKTDAAKRQLLGEIVIESATPPETKSAAAPLTPQPMQIKRALEQALLDAGVEFLYGCFLTDVLTDDAGALRGVVMANRNGRQAVLAKVIVDATPDALAARLAGAAFQPQPEAIQRFERTVLGGDTAKVSPAGTPLPSPLLLERGAAALCNAVRYTMELPAAAPTIGALAEAEQRLRDTTWTPGQLGASDAVYAIPSCAIKARKHLVGTWPGAADFDLDTLRPAGVNRLYVLSGCVDVSREAAAALSRPLAYMDLGARAGEAAAIEAAPQPRKRILCLGDSITAGGYPRRLGERLDCVEIHNAGVGGDTTAGALARCDAALAEAQGAAAAVIMFGTNDSVMTGPNQYRVPLGDYTNNLRALVAKCRAANIMPVLCPPPPIVAEPYYTRHDRANYDPAGGIEAILRTYQDAAKKVAEECGALYAPMDTALDPTALLADGVHPNRRGERLLADTVAKVLTDKAGLAYRDAPDALRASAKDAVVRGDAPVNSKNAGELRETLNGLRPVSEATAFVREGDRALPVLGDYDVVVAGCGTGGAPAGIAAARDGAKTLVVEYLHGLGGVGTLGLIGKYYFGNRDGFTKEIDDGVAAFAGPQPKGGWDVEAKMEWLRRELRQAGAEIWFGCLVCGTIVKDGKVCGVVVATPEGRGAVLAKNVIDATGNADVAAAAGAACVYIGADEIAVQGTGMPPRKPGASYTNTDYTMSNEADPVDGTRTYLAGREKYAAAFDLGQIIDSRERRRIVGDFTISPLDIFNERTYADSVVYSKSNFDSHGFTVHDFFMLQPPHKDEVLAYTPYRSLLPKDLDGLLVIGLGVSAHRDAMPILRMQPDIQNAGYAAGLAAAMTSAKNTGVRAVDLKALQHRLVEKGCVPEDVLEDQDTPPLSDKELAKAVGTLGNHYDGIALVLSDPERALPLLQKAWRASEKDDERLVYAHTLGILGDATGAETLAAEVAQRPWDEGWSFTGMGQFGFSMSSLDSLIVALGRTRDKAALTPILDKLVSLDATSAFSHHRAVAMALETLGESEAAPALEAHLEKPGMAGFAATDAADALDDARPENPNAARDRSLRELILVRALFRCGDNNGVGESILREYAAGVYGHYAQHATAVLRQH